MLGRVRREGRHGTSWVAVTGVAISLVFGSLVAVHSAVLGDGSAQIVLPTSSAQRPIAGTPAEPFESVVAQANLQSPTAGTSFHFDPLAIAPWLIAIALGLVAIGLTVRRLGHEAAVRPAGDRHP